MKTTAILPCHNEEKTLRKVLSRLLILKKKKVVDDIITINDGSRDNTARILQKYRIRTITHQKRKGKGKGMQEGARAAIKKGSSCLIFLDADMQHNPMDIPKFLKKLKKADFVLGSRYKKISKKIIKIIPLKRMIANKTFCCLLEQLFDIKTTDPFCGFRAIKTRAYKEINPKNKGYGIEMEMLIKAKIRHVKTAEISIPLVYFKKRKEIVKRSFVNMLDYNIRLIEDIIKKEKLEKKLKMYNN